MGGQWRRHGRLAQAQDMGEWRRYGRLAPARENGRVAAARESGAGTGDRSFWAPESADSGKSADSLSRDLGFNCIRSSKVNTYIMHRSTEVLYPLSLEVASNGQPTGTADPAIVLDDEAIFEGVTGSFSYLWRHTGCPGPYGTGCCF